MAEFAYHHANNASTGHMLLELNLGYNTCISFEEDINSRN